MKNNSILSLGAATTIKTAVFYLTLTPIVLLAQTKQQTEIIKNASKINDLRSVKQTLNNTTLRPTQLRTQANKFNLKFSGTVEGKRFQFVGLDKKTKRPMYYVTYNTEAAEGTATDKINSTGGIFDLDGENMTVHEWDGGAILTSHQEFGGRAVQKDTPQGLVDHSTHVAGTMIAAGVDPKAKGMAPKAKLHAYDWDDDLQEVADAASNAMLVSNHSYGFSNGFVFGAYGGDLGWYWLGGEDEYEYHYYGKYADYDLITDLIATQAPYYLQVKAAGNPRGDGPEPGDIYYVLKYNDTNDDYEWVPTDEPRPKNGGEFGFDTVDHGGLGKNILTVGAAEQIRGGYKNTSDVKMAPFSAFGPADDGRIKPDISGIGVNIYSTIDFAEDAYETLSGTSMASPNVAGSLLLLQELYKKKNDGAFMESSTLKALAIGTANEAGDHPGPDYASGWGLLNSFKAASTIATNGKYSLIKEQELQNNATNSVTITASGQETIVATLVWIDPAPDFVPDENILNDRSKMLVNDLDLRITNGKDTFLPWLLDPAKPRQAATKGDNVVDNVEQVIIENPVAGATYTLTISHKGHLKKNLVSTDSDGELNVNLTNADSQKYSLVVTGINNGVKKDLSLENIEIKAVPNEYSDKTPVEFLIRNKGTEKVSGAKLKYEVINQDNEEEIMSTGELPISELKTDSVKSIHTKLDLSKSFTNIQIRGTIIYDKDEVTSNNKLSANAFGTMSDLREKGKFHTFGFEEDLQKNGWEVEDINEDHRTWQKYDDPSLARSGSSLAVNFPDSTGTDDWLFSNPFKLKPNTKYRVSFFINKFNYDPETIHLFYGLAPESAAMTNPIGKEIEASEDGVYKQIHLDFTSPNSADPIYLGFHNKTTSDVYSYAVGVDDFRIQQSQDIPGPEFTSDNKYTNTYEPITFENQTLTAADLPILEYEWSFDPKTITFSNKSSKNSKNPSVLFNKEGSYTVNLRAKNSEGDAVETKKSFIYVQNTPVVADFEPSETNIFEGGQVFFTNLSQGYPVPTDFKWEVTPTEGVKFTNNTDDKSIDPTIQFNQYGTYTVKLKATSPNNSDTEEKTDLITVRGLHEPVKNLTYKLSEDKSKVSLNWERPNLTPQYIEGFEIGEIPSEMTIIDQNKDKTSWEIGTVFVKSGDYSAINWSWLNKGFNTDDWLVTPKLTAGAEALRYSVFHAFPERYDLYVVDAPADGHVPIVEEIKKGNKIHSFDADNQNSDFIDKEFDIAKYTKSDFFVAFHHRTKAEDEGLLLAIDDLEIGYDNTTEPPTINKKTNTTRAGKRFSVRGKHKGDERIIRFFGMDRFKRDKAATMKIQRKNTAATYKQFGITKFPFLKGFIINKNDVLLNQESNSEQKSFIDNIVENGKYVYDVYAVYSDDEKSEKKTVTVLIENLATSEFDKKPALRIYPNPSDGLFTVEAGNKTSRMKISVYDMSGKLIQEQSVQTNKAEINLTKFASGVYILNVFDDSGARQSAKLIIK